MGRVSPFLTAADCYLFGQGTHYEIYRKLGAHPTVCRDEEGVYFAVWAPRAVSVHVAGSFNAWSHHAHPMTRIADSGIFECFIPGVIPGATYMYAIRHLDDTVTLKADPYGACAQVRPDTASVVIDTDRLERFPWKDQDWMTSRAKQDPRNAPLSIYEVHPGSWKQQPDGSFLSYIQLAHELADYVTEMGYTHVEFLGIAEHPFDGSWGYQVTGYYAPTSRYGSPEEFMYLVDHLHSRGIGVILDWVPAHFPKDDHGLAMFDGTPTYEYEDPDQAEQPQWGTRVFHYGRPQVSNFLIANALYWVEQFHLDGLRVDAVASMLCQDPGADSDANDHCPSEDLFSQQDSAPSPSRKEAVTFLQQLNRLMASRNPHVVMIAEDSSTWPGVTRPVSEGGLGFTFKWNLGWMHDFLNYLKRHPMMRGQCSDRLTFGLTYAFDERYLLPLSHDEVVHRKCSILSKMPGPLAVQVANIKVGYAFMIGHPGKKLWFMGQDFGQLREWDECRPLDWHLTDMLPHRMLQDFCRDLLRLYSQTPALCQEDLGWDGFQWIRCEDPLHSTFSFIRRSHDGKDSLLFVLNFSPDAILPHRVGVPTSGPYHLVLNRDGMVSHSRSLLLAEAIPCDGHERSLSCPLLPYDIQVYRFDFPRH